MTTTFNKKTQSQYRLIALAGGEGEKSKGNQDFSSKYFVSRLPQYCTRSSSWWFCMDGTRDVIRNFFPFQMTKWPKSLWPKKMKRRLQSGNPSRKGGLLSTLPTLLLRSSTRPSCCSTGFKWERFFGGMCSITSGQWRLDTQFWLLSFLWPLLLNTRNAGL